MFTISFSQENIVEFFNKVCQEYELEIQNKYDLEKILCNSKNNYDLARELNSEIIYKLYFLHKLFTTNFPTDCSASGILEIPYFWKQSRKYIDCQNRELLRKRTPEVFLKDLVSNTPKYKHDSCGEFYSFGWCAEREMSFVALLRNMGFEAKIIAANGHAWTQVYVNFYSNDNRKKQVITIDNTFDEFYLGEHVGPSTHSCKSYNYNCEICLMQEYYNPRANDKIDNIMVSEISAKRIRAQIDNYFKKKDITNNFRTFIPHLHNLNFLAEELIFLTCRRRKI